MAIPRRTLAELERQLHKHAGLELPSWVVESRCTARMKKLGLAPEAYVALLGTKGGATELGALIEAVRVGETRFFRHGAHVEALQQVVIPAWRKSGLTSPRVWSAGCATGEEPYTLALVLSRELPLGSTPTILATDVSREALVTARRGVYSTAMLEHVPEEWRGGLSVSGSTVRVKPEIARLVTFEQGNLATDEQPSAFDLIWCRNVLIYFARPAQKRVIEHLVGSLNRSGFLFLGYSETLRDVGGLEPVSWADQVLYQKTGEPDPARPKSRRPSALKATTPLPRVPVARVPTEETPPLPVVRTPSRVASSASKALTAKPTASSVFHVKGADSAALSAELRAALTAPGLASLTVDFDAAEFVSDDVAPMLRRVRAHAQAVGVQVHLRATRPGVKRWLRRHRLAEDDA